MAFGAIGGQGTGAAYPGGIAIDGAGNSYLTGSFTGTMDFDGAGSMAPRVATGQDHFVAKYDAAGALVWLKTGAGSNTSEAGNDIAVDGAGNSYVTGEFSGTADFDGAGGVAPLVSDGQDWFVAKYDADGTLVAAWNAEISADNDVGQDIAVDGAGNTYLTGHFEGTMDLDGAGGVPALDGTAEGDQFVAKYDAGGTLLWARHTGSFFETFNSHAATGIAADGAGNSYVVGSFEGTTDFDGAGSLPAFVAADRDHFVAKYDAAGTLLWVRSTETSTDDENANGVAVDGSGNSYVVGYFQGTMDFASFGSVVATDASDFFVAKYDAAGSLLWVQTPGSSTFTESANGIAVDGAGNSYVTGQFSGTVDFDGAGGLAPLVATGVTFDHFVAKYDADGTLLWATHAENTTGFEIAEEIAVDGSGRSYVLGYFNGSADFDPGPGSLSLQAGDAAFFLAVYTPNGDLDISDIVQPGAPTVLAIADDTGEPDGVTTDRTLTVSGTAEADAVVHLLRDGSEIDTVLADGDGDWSWADPATLAFGRHVYTAYAEDTAGNEGASSDPLAVFVVDAKAGSGNGNDLIQVGETGGNLDGKNGDDTLFGAGGRDTLKGGNGNDHLSGGKDRDALWGGNGNDNLAGGADDDTLYGDAGHDLLAGGDGKDRLEGGAGSDGMDGGGGADTLLGGDGADTLTGGDGTDRLSGDATGDWIELGYDGAKDSVFGTVAHLSDDTILGFETGLTGDVIAITGLASKNGKLLDSIAITDGVLSLSKVGGGTITFEDMDGSHYTDTMLGSDGSILLYIM